MRHEPSVNLSGVQSQSSQNRTMATESPFKRKKVLFKKEEPFLKTALQQGIDQLDSLFVDTIPSEDVKLLPPKYLYPVGLLLILILIAIFIAVFVPGYTALIKTKFLSPVDSGQSTGYCDDVTISNTGNYLATQAGSWQGSNTFAYSNATYTMSLANVEMDQPLYSSFMTDVFNELANIGKAAKNQDLGVNLLYWMSWVYVGSALQRFTLTGTPLVVFNKENTVGTVSNYKADCNASSTSSFNPSTGIMQVTYSIDEYTSNPSCNDNGSPSQFGYSSISRASTFTIDFDIRTLITVVAVNDMVSSPRDLQLVDEVSYQVGDASYYSASYVDPRYPGMEPIFCLFKDANTPNCLLTIGSMYGLPVFNQIGANFSHPEPCDCDVQIPKKVNKDYFSPCNQFDFLTGFLYWPQLTVNNQNAAIEMLLKYSSNNISHMAFAPMFTAGVYGVASPERESFNSPAQRVDMYSFCNSTKYGPCSMVTISSFDTTLQSRAVSTNYFTILYGACRNSISSTLYEWDELVSVPFAPLTQEYQTCSNDPVTAFFTQVGVSAGNVTLLSPAGVLLVLCLLAAYQRLTGRYIPRTYSTAEKTNALEALAVALLLVRDKRVKAMQDSKSRLNSSKDGNEEAVSQQADKDAYDIALLSDLVEELGNIAPASESQEYLYREEVGEVVRVDWKQLSEKVIGSKPIKNSSSRETMAGTEMVGVDRL